MLHGTFSVGRVQEESVCRSSKNYRFTDVGVYKIHSNALMPNIPFEEESVQPYEIDKTIFLNDEETKLELPNTIKCQNFISARFVGRAPLEFYNEGQYTIMGRQFVLLCRNGNPNPDYLYFGTESAIRGYNKDANDTVYMPGGGEKYNV